MSVKYRIKATPLTYNKDLVLMLRYTDTLEEAKSMLEEALDDGNEFWNDLSVSEVSFSIYQVDEYGERIMQIETRTKKRLN